MIVRNRFKFLPVLLYVLGVNVVLVFVLAMTEVVTSSVVEIILVLVSCVDVSTVDCFVVIVFIVVVFARVVGLLVVVVFITKPSGRFSPSRKDQFKILYVHQHWRI